MDQTPQNTPQKAPPKTSVLPTTSADVVQPTVQPAFATGPSGADGGDEVVRVGAFRDPLLHAIHLGTKSEGGLNWDTNFLEREGW